MRPAAEGSFQTLRSVRSSTYATPELRLDGPSLLDPSSARYRGEHIDIDPFHPSTKPRRVIMDSVKFFDMGAASELTKGPPGDYNEGLETQYDQP